MGRNPVNPKTTSDLADELFHFRAVTNSLVATHDPSLRYLGTTSEAGLALAEMAAQTRSTVWNLQRLMTFYALRDSRRITEAARRRGVTSRLVVNPASIHVSPLLSSYERDVRIGPVTFPLMILDSRHVVVPGRDGDSIWTSSDPEVVALSIRAFEVVWTASRPAVAPDEDPPLTPRMVDIAWLLAEGASDRQISRELGVSERTVSADVREMGRRLGTTNRAHTIARLCGAPA